MPVAFKNQKQTVWVLDSLTWVTSYPLCLLKSPFQREATFISPLTITEWAEEKGAE